jgi:RNA polymerase sigma-70 factor (ECF subfamily)
MQALLDLAPPDLGYGRRVLSGTEPEDVNGGEAASLDDHRERRLEHEFRAGTEGLKAVWDAYGDLVYGFCTRTLDAHRARDATQEVFVTAWQRRDTFDPSRGTLGGWLIGIARNKVLGVLRAEGRHPDPVEPDAIAAPVSDDAVDQLADRLMLARALDSLPERSRRAVTLAFFEGRTHDEVADLLDLPLGTVKSDIRRGLERLRRSMAVL